MNDPRRLAALLAAAVTAGCAGAPAHPDRSDPLAFQEPSVVEGGAAGTAQLGPEALHAEGERAAAAGDPGRAAEAFGRLADGWPGSPRAQAARLGAARALAELGRWQPALERAREASSGPAGPEADEGAQLAAECLYRLGRHAEAREALGALAARPDLSRAGRARALAQRGTIELEDGEPAAAERSLLEAVEVAADSGVDRRWPAKARFGLGELARARFEAVPLDPASADAAELRARLELASTLLLEAQAQYLAAMRAGDPQVTVAAGTRIGELYEGLHGRVLGAALPPGLDADGERAYRAELRERARVLAGKAEEAYRETLSAARRAGVDGPWTRRAEEGLSRLTAPPGQG